MNTIKKVSGTFIRVLLYVLFAYIMEHGSIYTIDWKAAINAAVIGGLAVIVTALNPNDPRYGYNKTKQDEK